jgi:hypothetical protein
MSKPRATRLRLLSLLASRTGTGGDLAEQLGRRHAALLQRFGRDAEVLFGVRRADDPFTQVAGDRRIETADAILQVSLPAGRSMPDLIERLRGLGDELEDLINVDRSALAVGCAYLMVERKGSVFCGFLGRKDPRVTLEQMRDWWLNHHAPLGISLTVARAPHGYDQLHVDPGASAEAARAAGFPYVRYDMGDSLYIADLPEFVRGTSDPDIQRQLYEDELGFLDHSSWRGAFTDVVEPA